MSKGRKSFLPWTCCEKCQSTLTQKDVQLHESNCPPSNDKWSHSYIRNGILYSTLECSTSQVQLQNISQQEMDNLIFMAPSAMQLCDIPIGDPVIITTMKGESVVKTAWPTDDKTLTSVSITRRAKESDKIEGLVQVRKLPSEPHIAKEIVIEYVSKQQYQPKATAKMVVLIKNRYERNIFTVGNRITVPYYGKNLNFKIVRINDDELTSREKDLADKLKEVGMFDTEADDQTEQFYKALYSTNWVIVPNEEDKIEICEAKMTINDVGSYEKEIGTLKDFLDVALGKWKRVEGFKVPKAILIHGSAGVGKSMIANAVMSEYSAKIFAIDSLDYERKVAGETETRWSEILEQAKNEAPSIFFFEDIDVLCPKKSSLLRDNEKHRAYAGVVKILDVIRQFDLNIAVVATTSRPDYVVSSLRRPGRFDKELEVCAPTPKMRQEIVSKFLDNVPNRLHKSQVEDIACLTHGFVGADLYGLCSESALRAMKKYHDKKASLSPVDERIFIQFDDFHESLKTAVPSAMKDLFVEVPNVKWSEIGGQADLKQKLMQAVEWPLKHRDSFDRLGIRPPSGLLMFGPPGCSKTMIAKALATESKLNFLNIKGPELFSKWVGDSEKAVRQVFRRARQVAPSIVFIDEIDALGNERGSASRGNGGSNVQERVLAQLLMELDGVAPLGEVTLVAATNRPDRIDKALLRPGRLDRIVYVPLPDAQTRTEIFSIKMRHMPRTNDVIIQDLVDLTEGYSGAEIQQICNEAAMKALEEDIYARYITKEHFKAALSIVTPRTPASLVKMYEDYINNYK